ncbi:FkbM family methyltransferase [Burkholderia vietnamiensis]|nr:Methyltransferase FkbM [Burkholderia sp. KJ006]KVF14994.1 FkbM family methyltransferase [Burkholderia vietnamiensis]KVR97926.1 FkbM family methyltransferase [Burkholderia vietnamiensis]
MLRPPESRALRTERARCFAREPAVPSSIVAERAHQMKFVSYAQNFEDVMLWRALAKVERGFYIDVGASEPYADSVTAAFYERGWRGINIEPMSGPFGRLVEARPEDVNLEIAIENKRTAARYFAVDGGNGISTGVKALADSYRDSNWDVSQVTVAVTKLSDVCEKYVGDRSIHFLKIDVEGSEREVLASADFDKFRPWIVLVEATEPNSPVPSHYDWEELLLNAKYHFVYFDGLNRFYVADEKFEEFAPAFATPPNWFDGFVRATEANAMRKAANLEANLSDVMRQLNEVRDGWLMEREGRQNMENMLAEAQKGWALEKGARENLEARLSAIDFQIGNGTHESNGESMRGADDSEPNAKRSIDNEDVGASLRAEIEALRAQLEDSERRVSALNRESDSCYQELYESSRHAAWLSHERIRLLSRVDESERLITTLRSQKEEFERQSATLQSRNQQLSAELAAEARKSADALQAVFASTSWRLTKPLRSIKLAIRR